MTEAYKKRNLIFISAAFLALTAILSAGQAKTRKRNDIVKVSNAAKYQRRSSFCLQMHPNSRLDDTATLRFHRETQRCYRVGERGPCGEMMIFTIEDANYGVCDCDHSLRCGRPLIFWPAKNRCYYAYDQGPCREGKWLVFGFDLHPVCRRNPCLKEEFQNPSHGNRYWFSYKGQCLRTYTRGYCAEDEFLFNAKNNYRPTCTKEPECALGPLGSGGVQTLVCLPGQRLDFYGKCEREFTPLKPLDNQTDLAIRVTPRPTNLYCLFCKV